MNWRKQLTGDEFKTIIDKSKTMQAMDMEVRFTLDGQLMGR